MNINELLSITKELKILYVEDHEETRKETLNMLHNYFDHITIAINGKDGLEKFKDKEFDLLITDLNMPVMDGIEMVKNIRMFDFKTPIIIITVYKDSSCILEIVNSGIDAYILKPFNFTQINDVIQKVALKLKLDFKKNYIIELNDSYSWNYKENVLFKKNEIVKLTKIEIKIFKTLIENENRYLSTQELHLKVYGNEEEDDGSKVRNAISRLKRKIDTSLLQTNYNFGYIIQRKKLDIKNN